MISDYTFKKYSFINKNRIVLENKEFSPRGRQNGQHQHLTIFLSPIYYFILLKNQKSELLSKPCPALGN
ncbi:hypothetical protein BpHYR1_015946 [Brachionus plicatilis]|uniref:Uncharacterized protein n=1 Tax=Brachionus plicatilis TaxID=10195 RepID=A0A3M7QFR0_BRAPC|nr:hypothetical protein BpHYR1_015946 [Brachionus plicatilis]